MNDGDMAWMLTSAALVQLMTPGLAFFYGGLVNSQSIITMLMAVMGTAGVVTVLWALIGYSLAFGPDVSTRVVGNTALGVMNFGDQLRVLPGLPPGTEVTTISESAFMIHQLMFAIITPAIMAGAVVPRMRYGWWLAFVAFWHIFVYCPLAHYIFYSMGWLFQYGAIDFAGGMVIHTSSGVSAFVLAFWLGKGSTAHEEHAHNVPFVLLGAALLWFGWFGFNAGSALAANYLAARAFVNTHFAAAAAMMMWNIMEMVFPPADRIAEDKAVRTGQAVSPSSIQWSEILFKGCPTAVGTACGAVTGLVVITPGCGYVTNMWSLFIGGFSVIIIYFVPQIVRRFTGVDDRLDCFAFHGMGGIVGSLMTGLFATTSVNPAAADGGFYGNGMLYAKQIAAILATVLYSVVATTIIYWVLRGLALLIRIDIVIPEEEQPFVDYAQHGQVAYTEKRVDSPTVTGSRGMPSPMMRASLPSFSKSTPALHAENDPEAAHPPELKLPPAAPSAAAPSGTATEEAPSF